MAPALAFELVLCLAKPPLAALDAGDDPLLIELKRRRLGCFGLGLLAQRRAFLFAFELFAGAAEELAPPAAVRSSSGSSSPRASP